MDHHPDVPVIFDPAHQQNAPSRRSKVHGAQTSLGTVGALGFVQVAYQDDGAAGLVCHFGQAFHHGAHFVGPVHIHFLSQVCLHGVQDHQLGMGFLNGLPDAMIQHGEREICFVNGVDVVQVRLGFQQPWLDGVPKAVLGGLVENGKGFPSFPAGEGQSPAAGCCNPQGQSGLALGWVAVEDGQLSQGDIGIPEPAHRLHHYILQGDELQFRLIFRQSFHTPFVTPG